MTAASTSSPDLLLKRLSENASKTPNKAAFTFIGSGLDGGRVQKSYTYSSLEVETSTLAERLVNEEGLKHGDR